MPSGIYERTKRIPCSEETKVKIRVGVLRTVAERRQLYGYYLAPEVIERMRGNKAFLGFLGHHHTQENIDNLRRIHQKLHLTKEELEYLYWQLSLTAREIGEIYDVCLATVCNNLRRYGIPPKHTQEIWRRRPDILASTGSKISKSNKGKSNPQASRTFKRLNKEPEFISKRIAALCLRPTKPEQKLIDMCSEYILPYKYVGNGEIIIGHMNPDFININGRKQVIEVFGDYWHRGQDPQVKVSKYAEYGFDCLVIWENEFSDIDRVLTKVAQFLFSYSSVDINKLQVPIDAEFKESL